MNALVIQNKSQELLDCFLSGRNKQTLEAYRTDLEDFKTSIGQNNLNEAVSKFISLNAGEANALVLRYRNSLLDKGLQSATINRRLAAIRSLLKMARMIGIITWGIEIPNLKSEPYRDTRGPGLYAFTKMLEIAANQRSDSKSKRDVAILRLMYDLALRASELIKIEMSDFNSSDSTVAVSAKGKRNKVTLSVPNASKKALMDWILVRGDQPGPIFLNFDRSGKKSGLTRQGLFELIRKLGNSADVITRPHGLRHLSITEACKVAQANGFGLEEVLDHSRHASVTTLMIYRDREDDVQGKISCLISEKLDRQ
ncbi:MAG: tyrosine-type recombinase/integrase [Bdellovibrionales bacterium]|nr:tyrosine-type recombinase/integrase [Bdellovibrionales bacterium]